MPSASPFRLLVVHPSLPVRTSLRTTFDGQADLQVVATADSADSALARFVSADPDLVVVGVDSPALDGDQVRRQLRQRSAGLPILLLATSWVDLPPMDELGPLEARCSFPAMTAALEEREAARVSVLTATRELRASMAQSDGDTALRTRWTDARRPVASQPAAPLPKHACERKGPFELLVIGSSTGGPDALVRVLSQLPSDFDRPIVVTQHILQDFAEPLARRLDGCGPVRFSVAVDSEPLVAGRGYLAPSDVHVKLVRKGRQLHLQHDQGPPEHSCRPAVDPLFRSAAQTVGPRTLCLVLTGMGIDGAEGASHIHGAGGRVMIQDQESSVVWGMPGAVFGAGVADDVLPLGSIAAAIQDAFRPTQRQPRSR